MNQVPMKTVSETKRPKPGALRVLILADVRNKSANTIFDHVYSFVDYSRHSVDVVNAAGVKWSKDLNFEYYDVLILHYSICVIYDWFMPERLARAVRDFPGIKIQFIQDEYRWVNQIVDKALNLKVDVFYTVLFPETAAVVYKKLIDDGVDIRFTLTGYVSREMVGYTSKPIAQRELDVTYRGRLAPYIMGELGYEKTWIGQKFLEHAQKYDLKCDIGWREEDRIYGEQWLEFNASSRVCLGTESGAFIADFDSSLHDAVEAYTKTHDDFTFDEIFEDVIKPYEGNMDMTGISPRVFEAMSLKTALVMFPGRYSDILVAGQHYIVLEKDFSNIDEIVDKIRDTEFLQDMVDRNYEEFIASGKYSFKKFIEDFDRDVDQIWQTGRKQRPAQTMPFRSYDGNFFAKFIFGASVPKQLKWGNCNAWIAAVLANPEKMLWRYRRAILERLEQIHSFGSLILIFGANYRLHNLIKSQWGEKGTNFFTKIRHIKHYTTIRWVVRHYHFSKIDFVCELILPKDRHIVVACKSPGVLDPSDEQLQALTDALRSGEGVRISYVRKNKDYDRWDILKFPFNAWSSLVSWPLNEKDAKSLAKMILNRPLQRDVEASLQMTSIAQKVAQANAESHSAEDSLWGGDRAFNGELVYKFLSWVKSYVTPSAGRGPGGAGLHSVLKKKKSVLFLHQAYYHFYLLAKELRKRGWDAVFISTYPQHGDDKDFFHGEDFNIYSDNKTQFFINAHSLAYEIKRRFSVVHFSGINMMHLYYDDAEYKPINPVFPKAFESLREHGVRIGYSVTGCNDGVSQTAWSQWTNGMCEHCRFKDDPLTCSDMRNLGWGYKLNMFCDVISAEMMPKLDHLSADKVINVPYTYCVDETTWRPDIEIPEKYKIKCNSDEIIVMHAVGRFDIRASGGADPKGTRVVHDTIEKLKNDGVNIRLEFITGIPSRDMKYLQVQADIIIDQLYFGRYGAMGRECLMLGKPVISNFKQDLDQEPDPEMRELLTECPVIHADADTLYDVLKNLCEDRGRLEKVGNLGREFALKWHSVKACADRFERIYADRLNIK